ncbi:MAG: hypothetical protein AAFR81_20690 [Chloroflexota bacterium]
MTIRCGVNSDVPEMVKLSEVARIEDARHEPLLWRKAKDSATHQMNYYEQYIQQDHTTVMVSQGANGINGFAITILQVPPPIFDLPGYTCLINDFHVSDDKLWESVGRELLVASIEDAKKQGAVQAVVVNHSHNRAKEQLLHSMGLSVASAWYTKSLK